MAQLTGLQKKQKNKALLYNKHLVFGYYDESLRKKNMIYCILKPIVLRYDNNSEQSVQSLFKKLLNLFSQLTCYLISLVFFNSYPQGGINFEVVLVFVFLGYQVWALVRMFLFIVWNLHIFKVHLLFKFKEHDHIYQVQKE